MLSKVQYHRYPQLLLEVFDPSDGEVDQLESHWSYVIKKLKLMILDALGKCDEVMAMQTEVGQ